MHEFSTLSVQANLGILHWYEWGFGIEIKIWQHDLFRLEIEQILNGHLYRKPSYMLENIFASIQRARECTTIFKRNKVQHNLDFKTIS